MVAVVGKFVDIPLGPDRVAVVSHDDYERVSALNWIFRANYKKKDLEDEFLNRGGSLEDYGYATSRPYVEGVRKTIYMHRFIVQPPKGMVVDHVDGNGLHNWRENLRIATYAENNRNRDITNSTGLRGVSKYWNKTRQIWRFSASITTDSERCWIGSFDTKEEAGQAYDQKALELHGEFGRFNFPDLLDLPNRTTTEPNPEPEHEDIPF